MNNPCPSRPTLRFTGNTDLAELVWRKGVLTRERPDDGVDPDGVITSVVKPKYASFRTGHVDCEQFALELGETCQIDGVGFVVTAREGQFKRERVGRFHYLAIQINYTILPYEL